MKKRVFFCPSYTVEQWENAHCAHKRRSQFHINQSSGKTSAQVQLTSTIIACNGITWWRRDTATILYTTLRQIWVIYLMLYSEVSVKITKLASYVMCELRMAYTTSDADGTGRLTALLAFLLLLSGELWRRIGSLMCFQALGSVKRVETIILFWRYINKIELNWIIHRVRV